MSDDTSIRVFVGSSTEANDLSVALVTALNQERTIDAWHWTSIFRPGETTIESLERELESADYAVLVGTGDDLVESRAHSQAGLRDNVVLELGMFIGKLTRHRAFLLFPDSFEVRMPSDLRGLTMETWTSRRRDTPQAAVLSASKNLARLMRAGGPRRPAVSSATSRWVSRTEVPAAVGPFQERLAAAREEVMILGNDCKTVVESGSPALEAALRRGVKIRVICTDPEEPHLAEMLARVDPRFPTAQSFRRSMTSVEYVLRDLAAGYPGAFSYRYLPVLPSLGFFIVDPSSSEGLVKAEIYTPKPWLPIESRPHLLLGPDDSWRPNLIEVFMNYWRISRSP